MNKRQRKKNRNRYIYGFSKTRKRNKQLVKEFPWLIPRNRWTDKVPKGYRYEYTELDSVPEGWRKAFGLQLCRELKNALGLHSHNYRICQIKEKYGSLRWYDFGNTKAGDEVLSKYEYISEHTCIQCGSTDSVTMTTGWIVPLCKECMDKYKNK